MLPLVRYWLPTAVVVGGILVMVIGGSDDALLGGAGIVGAGLSIWLLNVLYRMGAIGDSERDREEAARAFFDLHGYWPDEARDPRPPPGVHDLPPSPHKGRPPHDRHASPPRRRRQEG